MRTNIALFVMTKSIELSKKINYSLKPSVTDIMFGDLGALGRSFESFRSDLSQTGFQACLF